VPDRAPSRRPFAAPHHPGARTALGLALVVVSAVAFGTTPSFARLAYAGGSDPQTLALARFAVGAVATLLVIGVVGGGFRPTRRLLLAGIAIGVLYAVQSASYLTAFDRIPVGVAVLIFFTFPGMVALLVRVVDGVPVTRPKVVGLVGGFTGVALTIGAAPRDLDPLGMALALVSAITIALFIVYGGRLTRQIGALGFAALSYLGATAGFGLWIAAAGSVTPPVTPVGWIGLVGASLLFVVGILSFFGALTLIDTVRASIVANLEPICAITAAWLLLGESMTAIQLVGGAIVVGAVLLPSLVGEAPARTPTPDPAEPTPPRD
jgi:drug/metabolite transporter (DMT)-like permease